MSAELAPVYRNLAHLHDAGVPWRDAFDAAAGPLAERFAPAREAIARGLPLHEALAPVVPPMDLAAIRAGEVSGRLGTALRALADRGDAETRRAREQRAALAYPLLVAHVAAFLFAVPDLLTRRYGHALLWAASILVPLHLTLWLARRARREAEESPSLSGEGWRAVFRTPAAVEEADARPLQALAWLHDAGVPPLEALPLAARAGGGGRVAADLVDAEASVRAGRPMAASLRRTPPEIATALAVGESAGAFSPALSRAATELEERATHRRKRFASMLPVFVTLAVGALVAWRVISYYSGLYRDLARF